MSARCNRCLETQPIIRMWGAVFWCRQCAQDYGGLVGRRGIALYDIGTAPEAYTPDVLREMANGAIMDSNSLFLPAGKLSQAEANARDRANTERLA